jgi:4-amino-4-deoxy-L-arabinose transferase-like glycosyltransferase
VSQRRRLEVLALILAVYAGLAVATSLRVYIWENEAWFASPAVTLDQKGYLGTTILESKGTWMDGIERRTYWVPPVHLLVQAAWYQLFGFSLFSLRSISILAGAAALLKTALSHYWRSASSRPIHISSPTHRSDGPTCSAQHWVHWPSRPI